MLASDPAAPTIGVDAGGSGCRARLRGRRWGVQCARPANLQLGAKAVAAIIDVALAAADDAALSDDERRGARVVVAAAGDTPAGREALRAARHPFAELSVLSDVHAAALGAHGGGDGGFVVLGTGAAACLLRRGAPAFLGGWGLAVDDIGSGADIGRCAVRAALRAFDGDVSEGPLTEAVRRRLGATTAAIVEWAGAALPADFADLAPEVFIADAAGDPVATAILGDAVSALCRLVALLRSRGASRVSVGGSIGVRLAARAGAPTALAPALADPIDGAFIAADRGLATSVRDIAPGLR